MFKRYFRGVLRIFQGNSKKIIRVTKGYLKYVSRLFFRLFKCIQESYRPNCSQTDLATDLPMLCKFKFVRFVDGLIFAGSLVAALVEEWV